MAEVRSGSCYPFFELILLLVLEPLGLCIKYRMLRDGRDTPCLRTLLSDLKPSEVEAVLDQAVDDVLDDFPQHRPDRSRLTAQMMQALESDASWVELYGITGELKVPALKDGGASKEVLTRVREVRFLITCPVTMRRDRFILL